MRMEVDQEAMILLQALGEEGRSVRRRKYTLEQPNLTNK